MAFELHFPVLLNEVLTYLDCQKGGLYMDGTFGAGGYTQAILNANPLNRVISFDRDPSVQKTVTKLQNEYQNRFTFINDCFSNLEKYLTEPLDGLVLDLGVSSMQIDERERGFSFRFSGPLDMRMSGDGLSAKDVVNTFKESEIADILFKYGEEKASRRIAKNIIKARSQKEIETTGELAEIIHQVMPKPKDGSDSAMRSFQALRIFVNDELGELERVLDSAQRVLKPNGRLVVVTFHSLEDRIVKNFMIQNSDLKPNQNRHDVMSFMNETKPIFKVLTKKAILPSKEELEINSRSHSAKLRAAFLLER
ncbi:MAG: 16S rRNA (cytosine(1402)-N(4))-methyltransferase RsmH [Alphaproteobacteria bacterium]|nr:16S rRNA (cytosine(1402)-N(4))-methyltransferase RsmH [Alphaproteobacteria bacterium]